jgi:hypothetical protein
MENEAQRDAIAFSKYLSYRQSEDQEPGSLTPETTFLTPTWSFLFYDHPHHCPLL